MRIFFFLVLTNIHLLVFSQKPVEEEQVIPPDGIQQLTWEKEKPDTVFELIDPLKPPVFPGGEKDLLKFIAENSRWPKECHDMNVAGMIVVQFVIDTFGQAVDLKILKTPSKCFEPMIAEIFQKCPAGNQESGLVAWCGYATYCQSGFIGNKVVFSKRHKSDNLKVFQAVHHKF